MNQKTDFSDKTYLIVDDFVSMLALLRGMLRSFGAVHLDQARNGVEAIALMERKRYDVVLCDYNLGQGKDGQQVLEEARHRALIGVDAIFMMVTGETSRERVMGAVEYTPDTYLTKPFTIQMLKTRLLRLFERKSNLGGVEQALLATNHDSALAELSALIAGNPRNRIDLLRLKADICLTTSRQREAMAIYDEILADDALDWAHLSRGKLLFLQKHYDEAHVVFARLLDSDPNFILAYDWLAKTQVAEQSFDEAEQSLKQALRLSPRNLDRQRRLGDLALQREDGQSAEAAFEQAVALGRHSVLNHPALSVGLAKAKSLNQNSAQALKVAGEIGKRFPDHQEAAIYAASATAFVKRQQGDAQGASAALQAAERSLASLGGGMSARLSLEMLMAWFRAGDTDKASVLLQQSIANNHDDPEYLTEVVRVCHATALASQADRDIRQIEQDILQINRSGVRLIEEGDYEAAIELLHAAAENMPGNKTFNLNAAKAWLIKMESRGASDEGIQTVRRYLARVRQSAPHDWRLVDIQSRLRQLTPKA